MTVLEHRADIVRLAATYGASNLRVVGSGPSGDLEEGDLDLIVDMAPDRSLFDLVDLGKQLEELLGRRVEVLVAASLNPRLRASVLANATAL